MDKGKVLEAINERASNHAHEAQRLAMESLLSPVNEFEKNKAAALTEYARYTATKAVYDMVAAKF